MLNSVVNAQVATKPLITGYQTAMITYWHVLLKLDTFYPKYTDAFSISAVSSAKAPDFALLMA